MAERSDEEVIAHLIATAMPRTEKVRVCARGDLVDEHLRLVQQFQAIAAEAEESKSLGTAVDPRLIELGDRIDAVAAEQEDSTTEFTLRSIGSLAWANLLRAHPPRPGVDHRLAFNLQTFPPAAVAACSQSPRITVEQAAVLYGTEAEDGKLHSAEWDKLANAAYVLNETATPHPKLPAAIGNLLRSGRSSTTAAPEGSPAPGSLDKPDSPSPSTSTTQTDG